jgi:Tfp pilus assembly protein PilX
VSEHIKTSTAAKLAPRARNNKREGGAALLITAIILVVVGALAFTSIRQSEQESTGSARSRASTRTFYAADAGVQLAEARLAQDPPDLSAIDIVLANGEVVQSRTRSDAVAQTLDEVGLGEAIEGEALNAGAGSATITRVYRVTVTATSANGSTSEVEAKINRTSAEGIGY